ncbi:hypothetical protein BASA81_000556 [Batrachochytrium salamandrivorans]|nr:hypothetical protein BASA81_000556 [Batrachochytrium salamandrivorans]
MVQSLAVALAVLLVLSQVGLAQQLLGFGADSCKEIDGEALVFIFDDFSFSAFSKSVGAYRPVSSSLSSPAVVPFASLIQSKFCQEELLSKSFPTTTIASAKAGVQVIQFDKSLDQVTAQDVAQINSAISAAGKVPVYVTGKQSQRRQLAAVEFTPLRMMPELFFGLFLIIVCSLALVSFFCCCMDGIATQTKFAKAYPQKGKEQN